MRAVWQPGETLVFGLLTAAELLRFTALLVSATRRRIMQLTKLRRTIMAWPKRVLTLAFAGVIALALSCRLPIAGQQIPQERTRSS